MTAAGALAVLVTTACTTATQRAEPGGSPPPTADQAIDARANANRPPPAYTAADVHFMSSMIRHHAQAVVMARWAPTHDASPAVRTLAERVLVTQQDEITFMQRWLRERDEPIPEAEPSHADMLHHADGAMLMPGMLTEQQLRELDRARGPEFDRLFLTSMIQHHQGAITMVEGLFSAPGAAQEETVFQFAADVSADQAAEIERMTRTLANLTNGGN